MIEFSLLSLCSILFLPKSKTTTKLSIFTQFLIKPYSIISLPHNSDNLPHNMKYKPSTIANSINLPFVQPDFDYRHQLLSQGYGRESAKLPSCNSIQCWLAALVRTLTSLFFLVICWILIKQFIQSHSLTI